MKFLHLSLFHLPFFILELSNRLSLSARILIQVIHRMIFGPNNPKYKKKSSRFFSCSFPSQTDREKKKKTHPAHLHPFCYLFFSRHQKDMDKEKRDGYIYCEIQQPYKRRAICSESRGLRRKERERKEDEYKAPFRPSLLTLVSTSLHLCVLFAQSSFYLLFLFTLEGIQN